MPESTRVLLLGFCVEIDRGRNCKQSSDDDDNCGFFGHVDHQFQGMALSTTSTVPLTTDLATPVVVPTALSTTDPVLEITVVPTPKIDFVAVVATEVPIPRRFFAVWITPVVVPFL